MINQPKQPEISADLDHFLDLAANGRHHGCSTSEGRAHELAHAIIANASGLDSSALRGMAEFARFAAEYPNMAARGIGVEL